MANPRAGKIFQEAYVKQGTLSWRLRQLEKFSSWRFLGQLRWNLRSAAIELLSPFHVTRVIAPAAVPNLFALVNEA